MAEFKSQLCYFLRVWFWTSYFYRLDESKWSNGYKSKTHKKSCTHKGILLFVICSWVLVLLGSPKNCMSCGFCVVLGGPCQVLLFQRLIPLGWWYMGHLRSQLHQNEHFLLEASVFTSSLLRTRDMSHEELASGFCEIWEVFVNYSKYGRSHVWWYPFAAITNFHKFNDLTQHRFILLQFGHQKFKMGIID